ncbi:MAG TPA: hypothetical protein VN780_00815 [Candidatus Eisenbacteria bacterium]|jgi:hypothetical protein|nr:hypothetical protein [Candidatus Eisenbacteria bacterium]
MPDYSPSNSRTLGICWVIYGLIRLLMAVWLVGFNATATVMFGALLTRVPDPYSLMSTFHLLYLVAIVWSVAAGLLGIVAGLALIGGKAAGRSLGIIAAFFSVSEIPMGVTIGTYTLVVLLPTRTERVYVNPDSARAA